MFGSQKAGAEERSAFTSCCQQTTNNHLSFSCAFALRAEQHDPVEQPQGQMARCELAAWWCRCSLDGQMDVSFSSFSKHTQRYLISLQLPDLFLTSKVFQMIYIYASGKCFDLKHCITYLNAYTAFKVYINAFSRNQTHDLAKR